MKAVCSAFIVLLVGCARPGPAVKYGATAGPEGEHAEAMEPRSQRTTEPPEDIVERSALPISGLRLSDGAQLSEGQLFDELSRFDAVCIGESHDDPHHHYAELALISELSRRAAHRGELLGVGLEMFQAPFQDALDGYRRGKLDEEALLTHSEYRERWGFPFAFYRPLLEVARDRGLSLLALNARRELTRGVARHGFEGLSPELQRELPEVDLEDPDHRQNFERLMGGHPKGHGSPERMYAAQVVWDETMAQHGARFLAESRPAHKLVIVAGLGHCARPAIPKRLERRVDARVASVLPSVGAPADGSGFDYALVMTPPPAE